MNFKLEDVGFTIKEINGNIEDEINVDNDEDEEEEDEEDEKWKDNNYFIFVFYVEYYVFILKYWF